MATYRVLRWRDIPMSVKAVDAEGGRANRQMPDWFGQEVDRVAMRDGLTGTDDYLAALDWSEHADEPGDAATVADAVVIRLAAEWNRVG